MDMIRMSMYVWTCLQCARIGLLRSPARLLFSLPPTLSLPSRLGFPKPLPAVPQHSLWQKEAVSLARGSGEEGSFLPAVFGQCDSVTYPLAPPVSHLGNKES